MAPRRRGKGKNREAAYREIVTRQLAADNPNLTMYSISVAPQ